MQQLAAAVVKETKRSRSATAQSLTAPLRGVRVLIVEDDFIILHDLETLLAEAGAEVIGPCQTVAGALAAADGSVSAAILDVSLRSETVEPVAVRLSEFGVPFLFYTGQLGTDELLAKWPGKTVVQKPADGKILVAAVAGLLGRIQDRDTS
jgi:DNA-binding response OmpR family regulator